MRGGADTSPWLHRPSAPPRSPQSNPSAQPAICQLWTAGAPSPFSPSWPTMTLSTALAPSAPPGSTNTGTSGSTSSLPSAVSSSARGSSSKKTTQGVISRRNFYIRRAFRILPAAAFFLAALLILKATVHLPVQLPEVLASLFFLRNYTGSFSHFQSTYPFYTSHFWSLAVQEHFYILLPVLLVLTQKKWRAQLLLTPCGSS